MLTYIIKLLLFTLYDYRLYTYAMNYCKTAFSRDGQIMLVRFARFVAALSILNAHDACITRRHERAQKKYAANLAVAKPKQRPNS